MSDSVLPHRQQPTRLPRPWDSPGKNTGVGCHFLLQCMKVKSESEVAQSCLTLSDPMDCSLPGSSIHGILQARVLECLFWEASLERWYLGQDLGRKLSSLTNTLGKNILGRKKSNYKGGNLPEKLREQQMKCWMLWLWQIVWECEYCKLSPER